MTRTPRAPIASLALLALLLAGCGSRADFTVLDGGVAAGGVDPGTGVGAAGDASTGGGGSTASGGSTGPVAGETLGGSSGAGGTTSSGSGAGGGVGTSGGSGGASGGGGGSTGAAAGSSSKAPIRLAYIVQGSAGVSALTGSNVNGSNDVAVQTMSALIDYANAKGGVGGRKISATPVKSEATSSQADRLALCKKITEDLKAEVLLDQNQYLSEEGWACFAQHKTAYFGTVTATDRKFLGKVAPYVTTTWMSLDRTMRAIVAGGLQTGYFKGSKVGVLLQDDPTTRRLYDTVLKPELASAGVTNQEVRFITSSDTGSQQAQTNSAQLAFAGAGVNRVLFIHHILVYLAFTNQAESQDYHPRYAFSDYQGMTGVAAFYGKPEQNKDAIGISASPTFVRDDSSRNSKDTSAKTDRAKASPGQRRCLDILSKQTGKDYYDPQSSGDTLATWAAYCEEFFLWWDAAKAVGASWTSAQMGVGLRAVGRSYLPTLMNSTDFSRGFHDGASTYRVGRYNADCACFPKVTGWLPI